MKVLIISEDKEYTSLLSKAVRGKGYEVKNVGSGYKGIEESNNNEYDLIIIEAQKDKLSIIQILEMILLNNSQSKVMIIKEEVEESEELQTLIMGVQEYVSKEKSFNIIVERIRKIVEKEEKEISNLLESKLENIKIDAEERIVEKNDEEIKLTKDRKSVV